MSIKGKKNQNMELKDPEKVQRIGFLEYTEFLLKIREIWDRYKFGFAMIENILNTQQIIVVKYGKESQNSRVRESQTQQSTGSHECKKSFSTRQYDKGQHGSREEYIQ